MSTCLRAGKSSRGGVTYFWTILLYVFIPSFSCIVCITISCASSASLICGCPPPKIDILAGSRQRRLPNAHRRAALTGHPLAHDMTGLIS